MSLIAEADRHDFRELVDEAPPGGTSVIEDVVSGVKHAVIEEDDRMGASVGQRLNVGLPVDGQHRLRQRSHEITIIGLPSISANLSLTTQVLCGCQISLATSP